MEKVDTTIQGPKVDVDTWQEGMVALNTDEPAGAAVIHREYNAKNIESLTYSCSTDTVYGATSTKMLSRMGDGIANIRVRGNVAKVSLCFSPGPSIPLDKISDTEWIFPDFTGDHFLNILSLCFCHDYLSIELEEPGDVTITWDCYLLNSNLRRNLTLKGAKRHYTESNKRRFVYSTGMLIDVQDKKTNIGHLSC